MSAGNPAPIVERGPDLKFCQDCGAQISGRAEICPKCGVRQLPPPAQPAAVATGRNRIAAALFAIFLGDFGIHKFYLGRVGAGVVYLIFFWTGIPAIIGFIEGIIYLVMSDQDFAAKYGK
ncbi:MAG TPA: zinc-ribbon domain and TM2 domain-containing protein [Candidatus Acidoferrum sp.]|nr:zinc-ribbon domain and TM2 domain-containing protein [Candidatus Acidoferrum sp.]